MCGHVSFSRKTVTGLANWAAYGWQAISPWLCLERKNAPALLVFLRWRTAAPSARRGRCCRTTARVEVGVCRHPRSDRRLRGCSRERRGQAIGAGCAWPALKRCQACAAFAASGHKKPPSAVHAEGGVKDVARRSARSTMRPLFPAAVRWQAAAGTARPAGSGCWTAFPSPVPRPWLLPPVLHSAGWFRPSGSPSG